MADLVTKLVLDKGQFDSSITEAQAKLKGFGGIGQKASVAMNDLVSNIGKSALKFAGWGAAVAVAKQGVEKFMKSGQTTGDWLDRQLQKSTGLVDGFFMALNNGSVMNFVNNMHDIADAIDEATTAADDFADAKASMGVLDADRTARTLKLTNEFRRTKDPNRKKEIQRELLAIERESEQDSKAMKGRARKVLDTTTTAIAAKMSNTAGKRFMEMLAPTNSADLKVVMQNDVDGQGREALIQAQNLLKMGEHHDFSGKNKKVGEKNKWEANYAQYINKYIARWGVSPAAMLGWAELPDDQRQAARDAYTQMTQVDIDYEERRKRNNRVIGADVGGGGKGGRGGTRGAASKSKSKENVQGSIAWYEAELSKKNAELGQQTDPAKYQDMELEIAVLEQQVLALRRNLEGTDAPSQGLLTGGIGGVNVRMSELPTDGVHIPGAEPDTVDHLNNTTNALGNLASVMASLSDVTKGGASEWVQWGANLIGSVSAAMQSLRAFIPAQKAASLAGAISGAASAGPFGWLAIGAAVASVIAAFTTLPAFETGGIVGGNSYTGDRVLARLNSGEMVLNRGQQSRLYGMIQGGNGGTQSVQFRLRGDELVGVINNYNKKINR